MKKKDRNDSNFNPRLVLYKGRIYNTGNRRHDLIEIFKGKVFYKTVRMRKVEPIKE